jgi:hypothetical protein
MVSASKASSEGNARDAECTEFLERLHAKLQDPAFRAIEGFPMGEDEATLVANILALSDPPYYIACPDPFLPEILWLRQFWGEAVRAGFAEAWRRREYATIVRVAECLPERVLQEDADLLMYYDNATLRVE